MSSIESVQLRYGRREIIVAAMAAVVLVASACSGGSTTPPGDELAATGAVQGEISSVQMEALADSVVTFEEYEQGMFRLLACVAAQGVATEGPTLAEDGKTLDYFFGSASRDDRARAEEELRIHDDCYAEHFEAVDAAYNQKDPLTQDDLDRLRPVLVECMENAGLSPPAADYALEDVVVELSLAPDGVGLPCLAMIEAFAS